MSAPHTKATVSGASILLLLVQLAIVSSVAVKYLYQRWTCPRVWTRTVAIDPELPLRGRYLSLQLTVDGCQSTLPSARQAAFPRNIDGSANQMSYSIAADRAVSFPAILTVRNGRLSAIRVPETDGSPAGQLVFANPAASCSSMRLATPVTFYMAEHAASPLPLKSDSELWIEVTIPPTGPPRPIQLALKQQGAWRPLAFQ